MQIIHNNDTQHVHFPEAVSPETASSWSFIKRPYTTFINIVKRNKKTGHLRYQTPNFRCQLTSAPPLSKFQWAPLKTAPVVKNWHENHKVSVNATAAAIRDDTKSPRIKRSGARPRRFKSSFINMLTGDEAARGAARSSPRGKSSSFQIEKQVL